MICKSNFEAFCNSRFAEFRGSRKSAVAFGKKIGMTALDVDCIRRLAGITDSRYRKKLSSDTRDAIVKEYSEGGKTYAELGKKYGVSKVSVFYAVASNALKKK